MFPGESLVISDNNEDNPDLSIDGNLVFEKVQYSDEGNYRCTATHSISGATDSDVLRLRVRRQLH